MRCPRCESDLSKYTLTFTDKVAIICESCGFADVSASHHNEPSPSESWEFALARLDQRHNSTASKPQHTGRAPSVTIPDSDTSTDRPEFSLERAGVTVSSSLESNAVGLQQDAADELNRVVERDESEIDGEVATDEGDERPENAASEAEENSTKTK